MKYKWSARKRLKLITKQLICTSCKSSRGKPHSTRNKQMTNPSPALVTPAPESQATKLTNQVPRRSSVGDFLVEVGQVLGHAGVQLGVCQNLTWNRPNGN